MSERTRREFLEVAGTAAAVTLLAPAALAAPRSRATARDESTASVCADRFTSSN